MEIKEVIQAGINVLKANEWCRGISYREDGGKHFFCGGGAIQEGVVPGFHTEGKWPKAPLETHEVMDAAWSRIGELARAKRAYGLADYNDFHATSKEDVIKLFEEALADLP